MKCPKCGAEVPEGNAFCGSCGASLKVESAVETPVETPAEAPEESATEVPTEAPAEAAVPAAVPAEAPAEPVAEDKAEETKEQEKPKKKSDKHVIVGIVVAVAVIVLLVIAINAVTAASKKGGYSAAIQPITDYDNEVVYFYNAGKQIGKVDGTSYSKAAASLDGSAAIYKVDGETYAVTTKEVKRIIDENVDIVLSDNGAYAVYVDEDYEMVYYNVSTGASEKIIPEMDDDDAYIALSPDGKSVLYTCYDEDEDEYAMYLYQKGSSTKIAGDGAVALSVSNSAKYIYAYDSEDEALVLYNAKGDKQTKYSISSEDLLLNQDHTEVIFTDDDKTFIASKGSEKTKISSTSYVKPVTTASVTSTYSGTAGAQVYSVSSFKNMLFVDDDNSLFYLDSKYETVGKTSDVYYTGLFTADGESAVYYKNGNLYTKNVKKDGEATKICSDVQDFAVSSDGKSIYYIDEDDALYVHKGSKDTKIADDVDEVLISCNNIVFFTSDDAFYYVSGTSKKSICSEIEGAAVDEMGGIYYATEDDDEETLYYSSGNAKFKSLITIGE